MLCPLCGQLLAVARHAQQIHLRRRHGVILHYPPGPARPTPPTAAATLPPSR